MSLFKAMAITCGICGTNNDIQAVESVNADRRPDLRDAILDSSFQVFSCESCGEDFRLQPQFNYLNVGKSIWLAAYPGERMPDYLEVEDSINDVFAAAYGARAQPAARSIGDDLEVRLTFGWPAVREKLLLRRADLSDVEIECLKIDLLRRLPEVPMAPGIELRVTDVDDEHLKFAWLETESEGVLQEFAAARQLLVEISDNADGWALIRQDLTNGPFVDMQKLFMGEGRDAA